MSVAVSGVANGSTCASCTQANGTYTLTFQGVIGGSNRCYWAFSSSADMCGSTQFLIDLWVGSTAGVGNNKLEGEVFWNPGGPLSIYNTSEGSTAALRCETFSAKDVAQSFGSTTCNWTGATYKVTSL